MSGQTYIVEAQVSHYPRHCEDFAERMSYTSGKLVDTGDRPQMVADSLRAWAAEIRPEQGDRRGEVDIYAAFDRVRGRLAQSDLGPATRGLILCELDNVLTELGLEWYGVRS